MNILLVNRQGNAIVSGVANHFEYITKELLSFGCNVERMVAKEKGLKDKREVKTHLFKFIEVTQSESVSRKKERVAKNRLFFDKAMKKVDCSKIDLVICSNDIRIPILEKFISRKKIIAIIPSSLKFSPVCNPDGYRETARKMRKNLSGVRTVVLSEKMKKMLTEALGTKYKIFVVPPGVDPGRFYPRPGIKKEGILYVGRIAKEKNIPALINSFSRVKTAEPLVLVGGGKYRIAWKKMARQVAPGHDIIFTGKKKRVEKYYHQAKLFVLPSRFEAFGLVIIEAMACGLPVIAFKPSNSILTASDEVVKNGHNGFLVKDEAEMAEKIDLLLKNSRLRSKMSREAIRTARKFNWADHVKKLISL